MPIDPTLLQRLKDNDATLTSLNLFGQNIAIGEIADISNALKHNTSLRSLKITSNLLGAEGASALAKALEYNTSLRSLHLGEDDLRAADARAIATALEHNTSLRSLDLTCNNLGAEGARALAKALKHNSSLSSLHLRQNDLGAEGARTLAKILKHNTSLSSLNLGLNHLGAEGARTLAKILKHNTSLSSLNLEDNDLGDEGARTLAQALEHNTSLSSLNLGHNDLGAEGARTLAKILKHNTSLSSLYLRRNYLGDEGARTLAQALEHNTSLSSLDLEGNSLGDEGVRALATVLERNTSLSSLNLTANDLGDEGARAIAKALERNTSLSSLDLGHNDLRAEGARAIATALEHNNSLSSLDLWRNRLGAEGAKALIAALEHNWALTSLSFTSRFIVQEPNIPEALINQIKSFIERNNQYFNQIRTQVIASNLSHVQSLLQDKKLSVKGRSNVGQTLLHIAAEYGQLDIATWLLGQGAGVNDQESEGNTPLHLAVRKGHKEMVELLLQYGAKAHYLNKDDEPALTDIDRKELGILASPANRFFSQPTTPHVLSAADTVLLDGDKTPSTLANSPLLDIAPQPNLADSFPRILYPSGPSEPLPTNSHSASQEQFTPTLMEPVQPNPLPEPQIMLREDTPQELLISFADLMLGTKIGAGGYGEVYQGKWLKDTDIAAKKMYVTSLSEVLVKELKREVKIMKRLRHPNVMQLLGISFHKGHHYLIMEYMAKGSLRKVLDQEGKKWNWHKRLFVAFECTKGLNYLHRHNIIHCDIKSRNVLIGQNDEIRLADFGLSQIKSETASSSAKGLRGTPAYIAPELLLADPEEAKPCDKMTDMYSFGLLLWEIASNEEPFKQAANVMIIMAYIMQNKRPAIPAETPASYAALISRCWAQRAEDRPQIEKVQEDISQLYASYSR